MSGYGAEVGDTVLVRFRDKGRWREGTISRIDTSRGAFAYRVIADGRFHFIDGTRIKDSRERNGDDG